MLRIGKFYLAFFSINIILQSFIIRYFYPIKYANQNLFFPDLIGISISIPLPIILLCNLVNIWLLILIGKKSFKHYYFIPALIYSISPWSFYSTVFSSFYIYILSIILLEVYSLILIKSTRWASFLFGGSTIILIYSSFWAFLLLPILVIMAFKRKITFLLIICYLPILFFSFQNPNALRNIYKNQIGILSDPGLVNNVNMFQGQAQKANLATLGRISENKYIYFVKFALFKSIKNIMPLTFFTSQEKLVNFSFSPPVYIGFLLPFLWGLYYLLRSHLKYLTLSLFLITPSLLSAKIVELNRLIIFFPVLIYIITLGLVRFTQEKNRIFKILLYACIILVIIQLLVTVFDINSREYLRYQRVLGDGMEIGQQ